MRLNFLITFQLLLELNPYPLVQKQSRNKHRGSFFLIRLLLLVNWSNFSFECDSIRIQQC